MADTQPTTTDSQRTFLSRETQAALDLLLLLAGPGLDRPAPQAATSATDEFAATRPSRPRHGGLDRPALPKRTRMVVEIHPGADPRLDPRFLGDPPKPEEDGSCSFCGDAYGEHWAQDTEQFVDGREWHRRDHGSDEGFYSDEIPAVIR